MGSATGIKNMFPLQTACRTSATRDPWIGEYDQQLAFHQAVEGSDGLSGWFGVGNLGKTPWKVGRFEDL